MFLPFGTATDREQHAVVGLGRGARATVGRLEVRDEARGRGLDARHLRLQHDLLVALLDALRERLHDVGIGARDEAIHEFDHADLRAEGVVYRRHLQPDDPAADDEQALGHVLEEEGTGGIHEPRVVIRETRDARGLRARRDDAVVERDHLLPVLGLHLERLGRGELRLALDHGHLARLGEAREALGELGNHAVLELAHAFHLDPGLAEREPDVRALLGVGDDLGRVQQRLRGMQPTFRHTPPSVA
jgi:hypothetical protein